MKPLAFRRSLQEVPKGPEPPKDRRRKAAVWAAAKVGFSRLSVFVSPEPIAFRRWTFSPEELREVEAQAQEAAAAFFGAPKPKQRRSRRLNQSDKVATLEKGVEWYRYLSEHFGHGKVADWRGLSWRGGVMTIDRVEDGFAFLGLMHYLVNQVAVMNASAALCPVAGDTDDQWDRWVEPTLAHLRDVRQSSKALRDAAIGGTKGEADGSARTD